MRVLVIEDEQNLRDQLAQKLTRIRLCGRYCR